MMNKDWTDELKKVLANSEITPSRDRWDEIESSIVNAPKRVLFPVWSRYAAAAVAACLAVGSFLWLGQDVAPVNVADVSSELVADIPSTDIAAGRSSEIIDDPSASAMPDDIVNINLPSASSYIKVIPDTNAAESADDKTPCEVIVEEYADDEIIAVVPDEVDAEERTAIVTDEEDEEYLPFDWTVLPGDNDESRGRGADAVSLGLFAGGMSDLGSDVAGNSPVLDYNSNYVSGMTISRAKKMQPAYSHMLPISFGLAVDYYLDNHWILESGATYSFLRSTSSISEQRLHMLGVPLRLNYQFIPDARFSVFAGAGGMGEVCLAATRDGVRMREDGIQWSASAVAGVAIRILPSVSLTLSPEFSYYFTNTSLPTYRTEHPAGFSLRAGLSFSL